MHGIGDCGSFQVHVFRSSRSSDRLWTHKPGLALPSGNPYLSQWTTNGGLAHPGPSPLSNSSTQPQTQNGLCHRQPLSTPSQDARLLQPPFHIPLHHFSNAQDVELFILFAFVAFCSRYHAYLSTQDDCSWCLLHSRTQIHLSDVYRNKGNLRRTEKWVLCAYRNDT